MILSFLKRCEHRNHESHHVPCVLEMEFVYLSLLDLEGSKYPVIQMSSSSLRSGRKLKGHGEFTE